VVKCVVNGVSNTYDYNGNTYRRRSHAEAEVGAIIATAATTLLYEALPSFSNPFLKQMTKEHKNNSLYKDSFIKAVKDSGLKEKGLKLVHTELSPYEMSIPAKDVINYDVKRGLNAFFNPGTKEIVLNCDKASISGFHELGHAMNNMSGRFGKILQKLRAPGYALAGLMGTVALFTRPKPKDAPRNAFDWVQDHAAGLAVLGMLPTVAEEALASHKGIKMAKSVGMSEDVIKNLKKFYGKALLSYAGYAFVTGLSVYAVSKIMEIFTRPEKIESRRNYY